MSRGSSVLLVALLALVLAPTSAFGWKFAVIADTQGSNNGVNTAELTTIISRINDENVDFVLECGDATTGCADPCKSLEMATWVATMDQLNCPYYFVPGNHDVQTSTAQENVLRAKVDQPTNGPPTDLEMVYSFDHENAHIIGLNSEHWGQTNHVQRSWLALNLADVTAPHVFVFAHKPAYTPGGSGSLDTYPTERDDFWNMLTAAGAGMYFCGHTHVFQRTLRGSVYQIVTGGAGGGLSTGIPNTVAKHHYTVISIDGNNVHGEAREDNGALIESWDYTVNVPTEVNCTSAKQLADGAKVTLRARKITYCQNNVIYVEEDDRTAGMRAAVSSANFLIGDKVNLSGTLTTNASGEREVQGAAFRVSTGLPLEPLGMRLSDLIGGASGYNQGAEGAVGCNTSGLLVKVWGRVTAIGSGVNSGMLYIDDGTEIQDGTSWGGQPNVGVRVVWPGATTATVGEDRVFTGVVSAFKNPTQVCRQLISSDPVVLDTFTCYNDVVYSTNLAYNHSPLKPNVTTFNTGYNKLTGYVARWTNIAPGSDGSFKVRAEAGSAQVNAYAFSAFVLKQLP